MGHDLMAEQVEVDPLGARAAFEATQQAAVEGSRARQVIDREREMEGGDLFQTDSPWLGAEQDGRAYAALSMTGLGGPSSAQAPPRQRARPVQ
jgi:hypothetical protein